jgi:hypothetical protein
MGCANAGCACQSELFVAEHGFDYCSEDCADAVPGTPGPCTCGHVGCSAAAEQEDPVLQAR